MTFSSASKRQLTAFAAGALLLLGALVSPGVHAADDEITDFVTVSAGSYIIDMGVQPQTIENGLKPYGLIYDLIINNEVPVLWSINPTKPKDGIDFSYAGTDYRGGPFIIPAEFIDASVVATIGTWTARGVVVDGPIASDIPNVPVYEQLTSFPRAVLDTDNGGLVEPFFENAEIPTSYYRQGLPDSLNQCDDVYAMPHADPTWETHENLLTFNELGGYIWAGCHAVSVLENVDDPADADLDPDLNFLTTNGAVDFGDHDNGTPPYSYSPVAAPDPIMQFIGILDGATENGSEQIYMPSLATGSTWRPTTVRAVYDPDQNNIPGGGDVLSPGEAAKVAYGRGFGDPTNGRVMYEGGHSLENGTEAESVAAQRAFFSFFLLTGIDRRPVPVEIVPPVVTSGSTYSISASVTGDGPFQYQWTSSCGGTFSSPFSLTTEFTVPVVAVDTECIIRLKVKDSCNRFSFDAEPITVLATDVLIEKTVADLNGGDVEPGDTLRYTITLKNTGTVDAPGIEVTDNIPPFVENFNLVTTPPAPATSNFTPPPAGTNNTGLLVVSNIALFAGTNETIVFEVDVIPTAGGGLVIGNEASYTNPAGPPGNALAPDLIVNESQIPASGNKPLYLYGEPGLELSRTPLAVDPAEIEIDKDDPLTWTLTPATSAPLTLSAGTIPVTLWLTAGKDENIEMSVSLDSIGATTGPIGAAVTRIVPLLKDTPQEITFNVDLASDLTLAAGSQIRLTVTNGPDEKIQVYPRLGTHSRVEPNVSTVINVDSVQSFDAPYPGGSPVTTFGEGNIVYVRAVVSDPFGSFDISNALLDIVDPLGSTVVDDVVMTVVNDSGGATKTFEFAYTVPADPPNGDWTMRVIAEEGTEGTVTDLGVGIFQVASGADLAMTKVVDNATPDVGSNVVFTLTVTNNGPSDTTGVVVADLLPDGFTYVSDDSGGAYDDTTGDWTVGALASSGNAMIMITATVNASGTYDNTATAAGDDTDPDPSNDSATASVTPVPVADLAVTKDDGSTTYTPGGTATYTIVVSNAGPSDAAGVSVADSFPAGVTLAAAWTCAAAGGANCGAASGGSAGDPSFSDAPDLPNGSTVTYTVPVQFSALVADY